MRGINFIIVKVKYQDAVISCFFWMSKLTECFFLRNRVEREKKLPSIPYSFRYWRSSVEFGWLPQSKKSRKSTQQKAFVSTSDYLDLRPEMLLVITVGTNLDKPVWREKNFFLLLLTTICQQQVKFASLVDGTPSKLTLKVKENFFIFTVRHIFAKENRTTMMGKKSFEGKQLGFCDGMFHRFRRFLERLCATLSSPSEMKL